MEFNDVLNRRYSCRAFSARQVEQEKVDRILEAGRMEHGFKMGCDLVAAREVGGGAPSRGVRFLFIDIAIHRKH